MFSQQHIIRIKKEEKAKIVANVWGPELIQFIAGLSTLHLDDLKKGMNSSCSSYCPGRAGNPLIRSFAHFAQIK